MDCSPPGSSVHGILQARILEWVAISYFCRQLRQWLFKRYGFPFQLHGLIVCLQINYLPSLGPRFHQSIEEAERPWRFFKIPTGGCSFSLIHACCMLSHFNSVQFSSVAQSCLTPWTAASQFMTSPWPTPRACSNSCPSSWMGAIQASHSLSSYSPAFHLSRHQGLFKWVSSSHQMTKVLELQIQHQSFQWIFRTDFL